MLPDDLQRARNTLERALRVRSIVAGLEREQFVADELVSITVAHYLQDIGEAARGLSGRRAPQGDRARAGWAVVEREAARPGPARLRGNASGGVIAFEAYRARRR